MNSVPLYVSKYTSFILEGEATEVFLKVFSVWGQYNYVTFEICDEKKYIISGDIYNCYVSAKVQMHMYTQKENNKFFIEFTKSAGDTKTFNDFFRYCRKSLLKESFGLTPDKFDLVERGKIGLNEDSMETILSFLDCKYYESKISGIKILAGCSEYPENYSILVKYLHKYCIFNANVLEYQLPLIFILLRLSYISVDFCDSNFVKNFIDMLIDMKNEYTTALFNGFILNVFKIKPNIIEENKEKLTKLKSLQKHKGNINIFNFINC